MSSTNAAMTSMNPLPDPTQGLGLPGSAALKNVKLINSIPYSEQLRPTFERSIMNYDYFLSKRTLAQEPKAGLGDWIRIIFSPFKTRSLMKALKPTDASSKESAFGRMLMYRNIERNINKQGKINLKSLLDKGTLADTEGDDNHSTLYHLYSMLKTQRVKGLDNTAVVQQTLTILNKPYLISQQMGPLSENIGNQILAQRQKVGMNRSGYLPLANQLTWDDLNVDYSAACVAASIMYRVAEQQPKEFVRQMNQLSSPMKAFFEKVRVEEIAPEDPEQAYDVLEYNNIEYFRSGPGEVTTIVRVPDSAILRAINDSHYSENDIIQKSYRNSVGTLFQSATSYMATRGTYDPATDMRDNMELAITVISNEPSLTVEQKQAILAPFQNEITPARMIEGAVKVVNTRPDLTQQQRSLILGTLFDQTKGLSAWEKTLAERVMIDGYSVTPINYQLIGGRNNPNAMDLNNSYLYGYTRPFTKTVADIVEALSQGHTIVTGTLETDASGKVLSGKGHEVSITGAFVDPQGEVQLVIEDTDDQIPEPVVESARTFVPRIYDMVLPTKQAERIAKEIDANGLNYFIPDQSDLQHFSPINFLPEEYPWELYYPREVLIEAEEQAKILQQELQQEKATNAMAMMNGTGFPPVTAGMGNAVAANGAFAFPPVGKQPLASSQFPGAIAA